MSVAEAVRDRLYLKRITVVKFGPTKGTTVIPKATDVFNKGIDREFSTYGFGVLGCSSHHSEIAVNQMVKWGTFSEVFGRNAKDLEKIRLNGAELVEICRQAPDKLRQDVGNFALLTPEDEKVKEDLSNLFVAQVFVSNGISTILRQFSDSWPWGTRSKLYALTLVRRM